MSHTERVKEYCGVKAEVKNLVESLTPEERDFDSARRNTVFVERMKSLYSQLMKVGGKEESHELD